MPVYTSLVVDTIYLIHMSLLFISHCLFLALYYLFPVQKLVNDS
jgi:hypothetical protein